MKLDWVCAIQRRRREIEQEIIAENVRHQAVLLKFERDRSELDLKIAEVLLD
jgi:hypothetical protein